MPDQLEIKLWCGESERTDHDGLTRPAFQQFCDVVYIIYQGLEQVLNLDGKAGSAPRKPPKNQTSQQNVNNRHGYTPIDAQTFAQQVADRRHEERKQKSHQQHFEVFIEANQQRQEANHQQDSDDQLGTPAPKRRVAFRWLTLIIGIVDDSVVWHAFHGCILICF